MAGLDANQYRRWNTYLINRWGLDPLFSQYVAATQTWIQQHGRPATGITSGYRSPKRQLELINRWEAGKRSGLVSKPALKSWHMQGLAIDVSTDSESFPFFREIMLYYGNRWGGNFRRYDPVHFDRPIGTAKTVYQLLA